MIPSAPTFRKIVLLLKDEEGKPTDRVEYEDSAMVIKEFQLVNHLK
jgi:hypothetical protein